MQVKEQANNLINTQEIEQHHVGCMLFEIHHNLQFLDCVNDEGLYCLKPL